MRRLIPLLLAVALLSSSCSVYEPLQAEPDSSEAPEKYAEMTFEELTDVLRERGLSDWQIKLLDNKLQHSGNF